MCDQETPKREDKGPSWTISACGEGRKEERKEKKRKEKKRKEKKN
jgi:hypothetical protein